MNLKILTTCKISWTIIMYWMGWLYRYRIFYFYVVTSLFINILSFLRTSFLENNSWDEAVGSLLHVNLWDPRLCARSDWQNILRLFFCFQALTDLLQSSADRFRTTSIMRSDHFLARITIAVALSIGRGIWRGISDMSAVLCHASNVLIVNIAAKPKATWKNTS